MPRAPTDASSSRRLRSGAVYGDAHQPYHKPLTRSSSRPADLAPLGLADVKRTKRGAGSAMSKLISKSRDVCSAVVSNVRSKKAKAGAAATSSVARPASPSSSMNSAASSSPPASPRVFDRSSSSSSDEEYDDSRERRVMRRRSLTDAISVAAEPIPSTPRASSERVRTRSAYASKLEGSEAGPSSSSSSSSIPKSTQSPTDEPSKGSDNETASSSTSKPYFLRGQKRKTSSSSLETEDDSASEMRQAPGGSVSSPDEPVCKKRKSMDADPEPKEVLPQMETKPDDDKVDQDVPMSSETPQLPAAEDVNAASPIESPEETLDQGKSPVVDTDSATKTEEAIVKDASDPKTDSESTQSPMEALEVPTPDTVTMPALLVAELVPSVAAEATAVTTAPQFDSSARVFPISPSSSLSDWNGQQLPQPASPVYSRSTTPYPPVVDIPSASASDAARFVEEAGMQLQQSFPSYDNSMQTPQWQNSGMTDSNADQSWMTPDCTVAGSTQVSVASGSSSSSQYNMSTTFAEGDSSTDATNWLNSMPEQDAMMLLDMLNSYDASTQQTSLNVNVNGGQEASTSQNTQSTDMQIDVLDPNLLGNSSQDTMPSYNGSFDASMNPEQAYPMQPQPGDFINLSQDAIYAAHSSMADAGEGAYAFSDQQMLDFIASTSFTSRGGNPVSPQGTSGWNAEVAMQVEGSAESASVHEDDVYDFGTSTHPFYVRVMPRAHVADTPQRKRDRLIWLAWRNRVPTDQNYLFHDLNTDHRAWHCQQEEKSYFERTGRKAENVWHVANAGEGDLEVVREIERPPAVNPQTNVKGWFGRSRYWYHQKLASPLAESTTVEARAA